MDPVGADAEETRRLHEDAGREDERRLGRLLRYFILFFSKWRENSKLHTRVDLIEPSCLVRRCNRSSQVRRGLYGRRPDRQSQRR